MPSLEKQSWMRPLRFNFLQLWAVDSFMGVRFSFAKIFVCCVKLCLLLSKLITVFFLSKAFLQFFLFTTCTIVFWDLSLSGLPNLWQASISWLSTKTSISAKTGITDSSKTSSETDSGIPLNIALFRRTYCAKGLWSDSYFEHRFPIALIYALTFHFRLADSWRQSRWCWWFRLWGS